MSGSSCLTGDEATAVSGCDTNEDSGGRFLLLVLLLLLLLLETLGCHDDSFGVSVGAGVVAVLVHDDDDATAVVAAAWLGFLLKNEKRLPCLSCLLLLILLLLLLLLFVTVAVSSALARAAGRSFPYSGACRGGWCHGGGCCCCCGGGRSIATTVALWRQRGASAREPRLGRRCVSFERRCVSFERRCDSFARAPVQVDSARAATFRASP